MGEEMSNNDKVSTLKFTRIETSAIYSVKDWGFNFKKDAEITLTFDKACFSTGDVICNVDYPEYTFLVEDTLTLKAEPSSPIFKDWVSKCKLKILSDIPAECKVVDKDSRFTVVTK